MDLEEWLEAALARADDDNERVEMLKHYHRQSQETRYLTTRDHEAGKKTLEEAKALHDSCNTIQAATEARLKRYEAGKNYLFGQEAKQVSKDLADYHEAERQREADERKIAAIEAKRLEEATREDEPAADDQKSAVDKVRAFFKRKEAEAPKKADEREKSNDRNRDQEWEP